MRDIKYRAWKKTNSPEMFNDIAYIDFKNRQIGINYRISFLAHRIDVEDINNVVLMQFTGLKDKNDVEIYEGDIVTCEIYGKKYIGQVEFNETLAVWFLSGMDRSDTELWGCSNKNVIGNIYQNQKLMEVGEND